MKTLKIKNVFTISFFIILITGLLFFYKITYKEVTNKIEANTLKKKYDSLNLVIDSLSLKLIRILEQRELYENKIDSLQELKPKIVIKYVNKSNKIDESSVITIVNEFEGIFSKNSIK